ncbi:MAG: hypothetical protein EPN86_02440 [Nanoarchaeota archaeon]|nr:MAG: hypothetical protein EPN86_02440 [Nanoarchaeota archaeon]
MNQSKWFLLGELSIKRDLMYRADFLMSLIVTPAIIFINYFVWKAVFSTVDNVAGFTFAGMMGYVVYSQLISIFIFNNTSSQLQQKVQSGDLAQDLLKPLHPFYSLFAAAASSRIVAVGLEVLPLFVFAYFVFHPVTPYGFVAVFFVISLILAFVLNFLLSLIVGLVSFWTIKVEGFQWLTWILFRVFSGEFFPLNLLPQWAQAVSHFMPFEYLRYRIAIMPINPVSSAIWTVIGQIIWIVILAFVVAFLWKSVLKRFTIAGG